MTGIKEGLSSVPRAAAGLTLLFIERLRTGTMYSPFGSQYWSNPYPMYKSLQSRDPCHASLLTKSWVLTRHDDITAVLRDPHFMVDRRKLPGHMAEGLSVPTMLNLDPPDHTRLRALVSKAFSQRSIEALRPRIEAITNRCLDVVANDGQTDIIEALAHPLPAFVIAELLGVATKDHQLFKRWADESVRAVGYARPEDLGRARDAINQMSSYFAKIAEERRRNPKDDPLHGRHRYRPVPPRG